MRAQDLLNLSNDSEKSDKNWEKVIKCEAW